ncbi:MAG: hypothetical protein R2788_23650 [Saprospiraceae bacterium]
MDYQQHDFPNAGVYTLYLFTEEGCVGNPQSITLAVTDFPQTPSLNVDEGELCEGQQLQLNSQIVQGNNIQYEWFNDGNGPVSLGITDVPTFFIDDVEISNSGQYNVSVLSNGCASQLSNTELVTVDNQLSSDFLLECRRRFVVRGPDIGIELHCLQRCQRPISLVV